MRTFLDIGSHEGQTLEEVTKPTWRFDRILAVEPMPREQDVLRQRFGEDERVRLFANALGGRTGAVTMYGTNDLLEASVFARKNDVDEQVRTRVWQVQASRFIDLHVPADGPLYVNMNCEGGEVPILRDLLASGRIWRISALLVDWDCRKVPGMEGEAAKLIDAFRTIGFTRWTSDYADLPTHQEQIAAWLGCLP